MAEAFLYLRSLHMLFGVLWVGGGLFRAITLFNARGDDALVDRLLARPWQGPYMGLTAIGTFGFGLATMLTGADDAYAMEGLGSGLGFFMFHGALGTATIGMILGFVAHLPTETRLHKVLLKRLAGEAHDEAQYQKLLGRTYALTVASTVLLGMAVVGMTGFRAFAA